MLDLKTIKAATMKDYLSCTHMGRNSCVRFENYKSNRNEGLSPMQKYGNAIHVLNIKTIEATTRIISFA